MKKLTIGIMKDNYVDKICDLLNLNMNKINFNLLLNHNSFHKNNIYPLPNKLIIKLIQENNKLDIDLYNFVKTINVKV